MMCWRQSRSLIASTQEIGFTGGEPTLLGEGFFRILRAMNSYLPRYGDPYSVERYGYSSSRNLLSDMPIFGTST